VDHAAPAAPVVPVPAAPPPAAPAPAARAPVPAAGDLRPGLTLGLLSAQHGFIHAQTALLPLVFIAVTPVFGVGVGEMGLLLAVGNVLTGVVQLAYAPLQRVVSRRSLLGIGGMAFGAAMTATGLAASWGAFSLGTIAARVAGSPQHPVGNALIAEQRPARAAARR
jgi:MFS family permease